jgi:hypothetical protein
VLGAVEFAVPPDRPEQPADAAVVLRGQHLGRGEQRRLAAGVDDLQHAAQRAQRLAGPDLTLQQPVHRVRRRQVGLDLAADRDLTLGQRVRQSGVECGQKSVGLPRSRDRRVGRRPRLPLYEGQLHGERLVPLETLAGGPHLLPRVRSVDPLEGRRQADQPALDPHRGRQRVGERRQDRKDGVDDLRDLPRAQVLGGRVDRDHGGREFLHCGRIVVVVQQDELRVGQLQAAIELRDRTGAHDVAARPQLTDPPLGQPLLRAKNVSDRRFPDPSPTSASMT